MKGSLLTDFIIENYKSVVPAIKYYKMIRNCITISFVFYKMYNHIFNVISGLSLIFYIVV